MNHIWLLVLLMAFAAADSVQAQEPPTIAVMEIPDFMEAEENGLWSGAYGEVLNRVAQHLDESMEIDQQITFEMFPLNRTWSAYTSGQAKCIYPTAPIYPGILSSPINYFGSFVFVPEGRPLPNSPSDLMGSVVAVDQWFDPEGTSESGTPDRPHPASAFRSVEGIEFVTVNLQIGIARLLAADRIDAAVGIWPDLILAAQSEGLPVPAFDLTRPLELNADGFVCHDTEDGRALIEIFNQGIAAAAEDGTISRAFGELYLPRDTEEVEFPGVWAIED